MNGVNEYTLLGEFSGLAKFMLKAQRLFPEQVKLSEHMRSEWKDLVNRYDQFMRQKVEQAEAVKPESLEVLPCQPNS